MQSPAVLTVEYISLYLTTPEHPQEKIIFSRSSHTFVKLAIVGFYRILSIGKMSHLFSNYCIVYRLRYRTAGQLVKL